MTSAGWCSHGDVGMPPGRSCCRPGRAPPQSRIFRPPAANFLTDVGGNATTSSGTATAGTGGGAEGAVGDARYLSLTSVNLINNVALGGGGGIGTGTASGIGNGGVGGDAYGGALQFDG